MNWEATGAVLTVIVFLGGMGTIIRCSEREARTNEATKLLDMVSDQAVAYYTSAHHTPSGATLPPQFPVGSGPFEYGRDCSCYSSARGCAGNAPLWERSVVWQALGVALHEEHRFRVSYEGRSDRFTVVVRGDYGCDGIHSEFKRTVNAKDLQARHRWVTTITGEYE